MRRRGGAAVALLAAAVLGLAAPAIATAHPLGNFTLNRLDVVRVSQDRVDVRWILDQAEIPTFQERGRAPSDVLAAKRAEALRGLRLTVDGRRVGLAAKGPGSIEFPAGQGGLKTTRVELTLTAAAPGAREVVLRDETFADRLGWRGMIPAAGENTDVTSSLPATEPTGELRRYPQDLLRSPPDQREISLRVATGSGALIAPPSEGGVAVTTRPGSGSAGETGFAGLFDSAAAGNGVLVLLLLASFGWGALHALSPGHGKAMVAAYLVGARGTARHAVILGATVTVTHTIGVFALGVITLGLSQYLLPEDLYPWLNLVAGLLVLVVGGLVLRSRLRGVPESHSHGGRAHSHGHSHSHGDGHDGDGHNGHAHSHGHQHGHDDDDGHVHRHAVPGDGHAHGDDRAHGDDPATDALRPRVLLAAGAAAGLIPCPSALVVLLGAIAQQKIALGLLLIVTFSLGLAATLTALGLAVVYARSFTARSRPSGRRARMLALLPAASALFIVVVGVVLTARAVPGIVA